MKLLKEQIICYFPAPIKKNQRRLTIQIPSGKLGAKLLVNDEKNIVVIGVTKEDSLLKVDDVIESLDNKPLPVEIREVEQLFLETSTKKNRKIEVSRLVNAKKKKNWRNSKAKELLFGHILSGRIPLDFNEMNADEVYKMEPEFSEFPFNNFKTNLNTLRKDIQAQKTRSSIDEEALKHDRCITSRKVTQYGYPFWPTSKARESLLIDLAEGRHERMKPSVLWQTRLEYKEYPERVFLDHIHQELRSMRERPYWLHKKEIRLKQARGESIADDKGKDNGAGNRLY